jgi:hypothetical protein
MSADNGNITRLRIGITMRNVLLNSKFRYIIVAICSCGKMLSRVTAIDCVLHYSISRWYRQESGMVCP